LFIFLLASQLVFAQYPPPAGFPGTTAIYQDSSIIIGWATTCNITRGYINMGDTTFTYQGSNKASYGSYLYGSGHADGLVVSLGDQGSALLTFEKPIKNEPGPDFAVFENAFSNGFLELGFVEVSSDGQRFVRFPSVSLTQTISQANTFDTLDATKIYNLAGKYRVMYGTPFDLEDLKDSANIDLSSISYVRIIDVGGSILPGLASYDSQGHIINDPWPTPFDTGGFDLDAVGILDHYGQGIEIIDYHDFTIFPNPFTESITIKFLSTSRLTVTLTDITGRPIKQFHPETNEIIHLGTLEKGIYFVQIVSETGQRIVKKIVKN